MATVYSVQRISLVSSTPVSRYSSRSSGRNAGSRNVFSPAKTRVMKTPSGLVTARTTNKKTPIWNQPFAVMSEFLRPEQRRQQIPKQKHANDDEQDLTEHENPSGYFSRSQPFTYKMENTKKIVVTVKKTKSVMIFSIRQPARGISSALPPHLPQLEGELRQRVQCEPKTDSHKREKDPYRLYRSNVTISPKIKRCCVGFSPTTPGCTSPSLKKPPPL